jgi:hypothetical protein
MLHSDHAIITDRMQRELCDLLDVDTEGDSTALHSRIVAGLKAWKAAVELTTHKIITCGVAASHPDANLSRTKAYGGKWDSPQAQEVRKLRDERDELQGVLMNAWQHGQFECAECVADMSKLLGPKSAEATRASPSCLYRAGCLHPSVCKGRGVCVPGGEVRAVPREWIEDYAGMITESLKIAARSGAHGLGDDIAAARSRQKEVDAWLNATSQHDVQRAGETSAPRKYHCFICAKALDHIETWLHNDLYFCEEHYRVQVSDEGSQP